MNVRLHINLMTGYVQVGGEENTPKALLETLKNISPDLEVHSYRYVPARIAPPKTPTSKVSTKIMKDFLGRILETEPVRKLLAVAFIECLLGGKYSFTTVEMRQRFVDCEIELPAGTAIMDILALAEEFGFIENIDADHWKLTLYWAVRESLFMYKKSFIDDSNFAGNLKDISAFQVAAEGIYNTIRRGEIPLQISPEGLMLKEEINLKIWKIGNKY